MIKSINKMYFYGLFGHIWLESNVWMLFLLHFGIVNYEIGFMQLTFNLVSGTFEIPLGYICDKIGMKKMLVTGHFLRLIYISLFILIIFVEKYKMLYAIIAMVIWAISYSCLNGVDHSLIYSNLNENEDYNKIISIYNSLSLTSVLLSSLLASYLVYFSWSIFFSILFIIQAIFVLFVMIIIKENKCDNTQNNNNTKFDIKDIVILFNIKDKKIFLMCVIGVMQGVFSIFVIFLQIFLLKIKVDVKLVPIIISITTIIQILLSSQIHKIIAVFKNINTLISVSIIINIIFLLSILISNVFIVIVSVVIININYELWDTSLNIVFHDEMDDESRVTSSSIVNFVCMIVMAILSITIPLLFNYIGAQLTYSIIGIFTIIFVLLLWNKFIKLQKIYKKSTNI